MAFKNWYVRMALLMDFVLTLPKLKDETWILRHRIKTIAQGIVDRHYGLFPSPEFLTQFANDHDAEKGSRRFTRNRVDYLTDDSSRYLAAPAETDVCTSLTDTNRFTNFICRIN